MAKPSLKPKNTKQQKVKRVIKEKALTQSAQEPDIAAIWAEEIKQLRTQRFQSTEQACEALLELVLDRLKTSSKLRGDTKEFLKMVILTDPEFSEELAGLVE